jgi:hypothetical protein
MKNYLLLITLFIFCIGCKSPEKLLQQGDYDSVIDKTMKDILKGKADNNDKELFNKAYNMANQRDQQRIDFLLQENKPENWEQIYRLYSSLDARQAKARQVMPLNIGGRQVNYRFIDYNAKIIEAKKNAAKFYYSTGVSSMDRNTKESYREAFYDFQKVKEYRASDYPDLDNLMDEARYQGVSRVLIEFNKATPGKIPSSAWNNLQSISTSNLNGQWVEYHLARIDPNTLYDYFITVTILGIDVGRPLETTKEYVRRKKIQDGYDYVRDSRGHVMKDSLGNDIKVPRYKDLVCTVIETKQSKSVTLRGDVEFVSANPSRLLKKEPVAGTSVFEHTSGKAAGDRDALLPEDLKLLQLDEVPFPDDFSMIDDCSIILRQSITDLIYNNRNLIY